jgi:hypothetical protein
MKRAIRDTLTHKHDYHRGKFRLTIKTFSPMKFEIYHFHANSLIIVLTNK